MFTRNITNKTMILLIGFVALTALAASPASAASILYSKHDFRSVNSSTSGFAGAFEAPDDQGFVMPIDQVCVFCHTPHGGVSGTAPLWNRTTTSTAYTYKMYSSTSASGVTFRPDGVIGSAGGPTGISALCMSCHDGVTSVAVGTLLNPPGTGPVTTTMTTGALGDVYWEKPDGTKSFNGGWGPNIGNNYPGSGNANIDLSNDHPISFVYPASSPGIWPMANLSGTKLRLFGSGKDMVECATCHLVHDPQYPPFLAMQNDGSQMCLTCHNK